MSELPFEPCPEPEDSPDSEGEEPAWGPPTPLRPLIERTYADVLAFLVRLHRPSDVGSPEDWAHDAFVTISEKWEPGVIQMTGSTDMDFLRVFCRFALNAMWSARRRGRRNEARCVPLPNDDTLPAGNLGVVDAVAENDLVSAIATALERLSPDQRQALLLHCQELSPEEIAVIMNRSRGAVYTLVSRARERLRGFLSDGGLV